MCVQYQWQYKLLRTREKIISEDKRNHPSIWCGSWKKKRIWKSGHKGKAIFRRKLVVSQGRTTGKHIVGLEKGEEFDVTKISIDLCVMGDLVEIIY